MAEGGPFGQPGCLVTALVFLLIVAPLYLLLRFFVKVIRAAYGFDQAADDEPPLRICAACHNSILEEDYQHCPYCGAPLDRKPTST
jgi:uncharacterized paraquat-inducible protein A